MRQVILILSLFVPLSGCEQASLSHNQIDGPLPPYTFVRVEKSRDGKRVGASTRVSEYRKGAIRVTLVSLIHIGTEKYFDLVAERINKAERIISEGLDPRLTETDVPTQITSLRRQYEAMAWLTGLTTQTRGLCTEIDDRWSYADLSLSQWREIFDRGDFKVIDDQDFERVQHIEELRLRGPPPEDGAVWAKRVLVSWIQNGVEGKIPSTALDRRREELAVQQIFRALGESQHVAVLYGAAHSPAIARALSKRGFRLESVEWHQVFLFDMSEPNATDSSESK